jgi:hypothetical protein
MIAAPWSNPEGESAATIDSGEISDHAIEACDCGYLWFGMPIPWHCLGRSRRRSSQVQGHFSGRRISGIPQPVWHLTQSG